MSGYLGLAIAMVWASSLAWQPGPASAAPPPGRPGMASQAGLAAVPRLVAPHPVNSLLLDWYDARRSRAVPVRVYFAADLTEPAPVVVFSHDVGYTRDDYAYLGTAWASHGYVTVHVQHAGSDRAQRELLHPRESMRRAFEDANNTLQRGLDIRFVLDQLEMLDRGHGPLAGRLDLARVGVAGHELGALTALALAGQVIYNSRGQPLSITDARVRAVLAISPPVAAQKDIQDAVYNVVRVPCLHITGTCDDSLLGSTRAGDRRVPFDEIHGADQFLVTFFDADNGTFPGHRRQRVEGRTDPLLHELTTLCSLAFWDSQLRRDPRAIAWMEQGGLSNLIGMQGVAERKLVAGPMMTAAHLGLER